MKIKNGYLVVIGIILVCFLLFSIFQKPLSLDVNLTNDGKIRVAFVWFYEDNPPPYDWKDIILADAQDLDKIIQLCPEYEFGYDGIEKYYDVNTFYNIHIPNLEWEWICYGEVIVPYYTQHSSRWNSYRLMAKWYKQDPVEALKVWNEFDIVYGIHQSIDDRDGFGTGGFACLSSSGIGMQYYHPIYGEDGYKTEDDLRRRQTKGIAHEILHSFGASDHFENTNTGTCYNCIMGLGPFDEVSSYCEISDLTRAETKDFTEMYKQDEIFADGTINNIEGYFSLNGNKIESGGTYTVNSYDLVLEFTSTEMKEFVESVYLKDQQKHIEFDKITDTKWKLEYLTHNPYPRCYISTSYKEMHLVTDFKVIYDVAGPDPPLETPGFELMIMITSIISLIIYNIFNHYWKKQ